MNTATRPVLENRRPETPVSVIPRPAWLSEKLFPFVSRKMEVDDTSLHYLDEGTGPVLFMVPGTPMWTFMYRKLIQELRDEFRCVAVDLPGLGLSEAPLYEGKAFTRAADLLQMFVRRLDLQDVTLVAQTTAGPPALEMAVREQSRIRALVLSNSFAWAPEHASLKRFARVVGNPVFAFLNVRLNLLPRMALRAGRRNGPFSTEEQAAIIGPFHNKRTREHLQNYANGIRGEQEMFRSLPSRLAAIHQKPALFLEGAYSDGFKAGLLKKWEQLLPNHKTVVLLESGHFLLEDQPDRYAAELKLWFNKNIRG